MSLITLRCKDMSATVDTDRGGSCISLRQNAMGLKILREAQSDVLDNPFLYGVPILFPVNRISGGSFVFEGRIYKFPVNEEDTGCHLHGELHCAPFELVSHNESCASFVFHATKEKPYLAFPHEFSVSRSYFLDENGLTLKTEIINHSSTNMPLLLGFHTTFSLPFSEVSSVKDIKIKAPGAYAYERDEKYLPTGKIISDSPLLNELNIGTLSLEKKQVSIHFKTAAPLNMCLHDTESGVKIVYAPDEKFAYRLVYGNGDAGFVSLEPYTCLANCPNVPKSLQDDNGFMFLRPSEKIEFVSRIYVERAE